MTTPAFWLLLALFAQVLLTFVIYGVLYQRRIPRIVAGKIRVADIALSAEAWPLDSRQAGNALTNQFEAPVLFYVAVGVGLFLGIGWFEVVLGFAFVASRCVHAVIHVTSNHVIRRFTAFAAGVVILGILWLDLLIRLVATMIASS
jgi:hypothetical protein